MALPSSNAEAFIVSISPFTVTLPPNCDVLSVATVKAPSVLVVISVAPIATEVALALPNSNAEAFIVSISPFTVTLPPNCDVLSVVTVKAPSVLVVISAAPIATEVALALPSSNAEAFIVSISPFTVRLPPNCDVLSVATVKAPSELVVISAAPIATAVAVDLPSSNAEAFIVSISPFTVTLPPNCDVLSVATVKAPSVLVVISAAPIATEVALALPSSNAEAFIVSISPFTVRLPPNCDVLSVATVKAPSELVVISAAPIATAVAVDLPSSNAEAFIVSISPFTVTLPPNCDVLSVATVKAPSELVVISAAPIATAVAVDLPSSNAEAFIVSISPFTVTLPPNCDVLSVVTVKAPSVLVVISAAPIATAVAVDLPSSNAEAFIVSISPFTVRLPPNCDVLSVATVKTPSVLVVISVAPIATEVALALPNSNAEAPIVSISPFTVTLPPNCDVLSVVTVKAPSVLVVILVAPIATEVALALPSSNAEAFIVSISPFTVRLPPNCDVLSVATVKAPSELVVISAAPIATAVAVDLPSSNAEAFIVSISPFTVTLPPNCDVLSVATVKAPSELVVISAAPIATAVAVDLPSSNAEAFIVSISPFTVTLPPNCDVLSVATVKAPSVLVVISAAPIATEVALALPSSNAEAFIVSISPFTVRLPPNCDVLSVATVKAPSVLVVILVAPIATEVALALPSSNAEAPIVSISPFTVTLPPNCDVLSVVTVKAPSVLVVISAAPIATEVALALPSSNAEAFIVSISPFTVRLPPNCDVLSVATVKAPSELVVISAAPIATAVAVDLPSSNAEAFIVSISPFTVELPPNCDVLSVATVKAPSVLVVISVAPIATK